MTQPHILLVEDDHELGHTLKAALEVAHYTVTLVGAVAPAMQLLQAFGHVQAKCFDLLILDLGLPDGDGSSLLHWVREQALAMPVLVISARHDDVNKVGLLDAGADDYLVKPFSISELLARMRVAFRHKGASAQAPVLHYKDAALEIHVPKHEVWWHGQPVKLTPTEFKLLARLLRSVGQVVTHRQLLLDVWGSEFVEHTHYLRVYMAQLRTKLEDDPTDPQRLQTEPGVGYRLRESH